MNYLIETADGQLLGGLLVAEAANAITLRGVDGAQATIARERIERFQSTGKSLMPEGFEQKLAPQDIADVLAFLTQTESKAPPKPRP
jgi:putative heme-binding domain-containing protein